MQYARSLHNHLFRKKCTGLSASDWRMVVVVPTAVAADPVVAANDFQELICDPQTGITSTWTKVANGVYKVKSRRINRLLIRSCYHYSGTNISIPDQQAQISASSSSNETYSVGPPATYSWKFLEEVMEPD